jgi:Tfp pilus assembly protein PilV
MQIKKGQTLIEVVVALSILIVVFTGVVSLTMSVVNLTLASKDQTEAVAFAQKVLTDYDYQLTQSCPIGAPAFGAGQCSLPSDPDLSKFTCSVYKNPISSALVNQISNSLVSDELNNLTVTVSWDSKGIPGAQSITLNQVIGN